MGVGVVEHNGGDTLTRACIARVGLHQLWAFNGTRSLYVLYLVVVSPQSFDCFHM